MATTEPQEEINNRPSLLVDMRTDLLVRIALLGLGLGVALWLLTWVFASFIIGPIFCGGGNVCGNTNAIAGNIALVLTAVAGMLGLVRMGVYRPMLIAIAVVATLWNIGAWLNGIVWYEALGWAALITMFSYAAYAWLVRVRNFVIILIVLIIIVIVIRYLSTL